MSSSIWLDVSLPAIVGRDATGQVVQLVLPSADGGPGLETPQGTIWRAAGFGPGLDTLLGRWRDLRLSGELNRRRVALAMRRAESLRELLQVAIDTGSSEPIVQLVEEARGMGIPIPAPLARAVAAVNRLERGAIEAAETIVNPFNKTVSRLVTAGKWGLGIYLGVKVVEIVRGK